MSFHEKSAWGCLLAILLVYIPYFYFVFQHPVAYVGLFVVAVVVLVVLLSGFHIVLAITAPRVLTSGETPPMDERDVGIELRSSKIAGLVLGMAVLIWSVAAMLGIPYMAISNANLAAEPPASLQEFAIPAVQSLWAIHYLFAGFVFANAVYYASIVIGYRRAS